MKYFLILLLLVAGNVHAHKGNALTETDCLAYTVYREASGEPFKGRKAVLDVLKNRMRLREKNACSIMREAKQFSFYNKHTKVKMPIEALMDFFEVDEADRVLDDDAEYFHAVYVHPKWMHEKHRIMRIKNHVFYRDIKRK